MSTDVLTRVEQLLALAASTTSEDEARTAAAAAARLIKRHRLRVVTEAGTSSPSSPAPTSSAPRATRSADRVTRPAVGSTAWWYQHLREDA